MIRRTIAMLTTLATLCAVAFGVAVAGPASAQVGTNPVVQTLSVASQPVVLSQRWTANGLNYKLGPAATNSYVQNTGTSTIWVLVENQNAFGQSHYYGAVTAGQKVFLTDTWAGFGPNSTSPMSYQRWSIVRKDANGDDCTAYAWISPMDEADQSNAVGC